MTRSVCTFKTSEGNIQYRKLPLTSDKRCAKIERFIYIINNSTLAGVPQKVVLKKPQSSQKCPKCNRTQKNLNNKYYSFEIRILFNNGSTQMSVAIEKNNNFENQERGSLSHIRTIKGFYHFFSSPRNSQSSFEKYSRFL